MKLLSVIGGLAVVTSLAANGYFLWVHREGQAIATGQQNVPEVVHVKGGLLEVSTVHGHETFEATSDEAILGIPVGKTVARIRVPAVYRYHVELAPEWKVLLKDKVFIVISPSVKPSLPVAIDTGRLESQSSGQWAVFTGNTRVAELQRSITKVLTAKADQPAYIQLQREVARRAVKEFVAKWLITQERWKSASSYPVHVFFADEPIQALKSVPQPFVGAL